MDKENHEGEAQPGEVIPPMCTVWLVYAGMMATHLQCKAIDPSVSRTCSTSFFLQQGLGQETVNPISRLFHLVGHVHESTGSGDEGKKGPLLATPCTPISSLAQVSSLRFHLGDEKRLHMQSEGLPKWRRGGFQRDGNCRKKLTNNQKDIKEKTKRKRMGKRNMW